MATTFQKKNRKVDQTIIKKKKNVGSFKKYIFIFVVFEKKTIYMNRVYTKQSKIK